MRLLPEIVGKREIVGRLARVYLKNSQSKIQYIDTTT